MTEHTVQNFDRDLAGFHKNARQMEAIRVLSSGKVKYFLYGGGLGGGKSYLLRWYCIRFLLDLYKKHKMTDVPVMLACENYPALKDRQLSKIKREFPDYLGKFYGEHSEYGRCFVLSPEYSGGIICFRNLDDSAKYQSAEFALICVDELTKNDYDTFTFLRTRNRWPGLPNIECQFVGATNPGGIGHCVPHGDVLTPKGWMDIKDFKVGDGVYTVLSNGELAESVVDQVHRSPYNGDMVRVEARGLSMTCTPNHSVAKIFGIRDGFDTRTKIKNLFSLVPFSDLPGQATILRSVKFEGPPIGTFKVDVVPTRKRKLNQPTELSGVDYASLTGWVLTEGCTIDVHKALAIAQIKSRTREKLEKLLIRCGFSYNENYKGFLMYAIDWWNYYRQFGKCRDKYVPENLKNCSQDEMYALFEAMVDGDGHWVKYGKSGAFYSFSKQLSEDFAEISIKLGYIVHTASRQKPNRVGLEYRVDFKKTKSGGTELLTGNHVYDVSTDTKRKSNVWRENYQGEVYCIGVPETHSFIIRQNGAVWVSGNSWVKALWIDKTFGREWIKPIDYRDQFAFVKSLASDNPFIDPSYEAMLSTLPVNLRKAFKEGRWDIFVGQAFSDFNPAIHVIKPIPIPGYAQLYMTFDWGYGKPFSVGWWWVDTEGVVFRFAEWYGWDGTPDIGLRMTDEEMAKGIVAREEKMKINNRPIIRLCDPTCHNKKPDYQGGGQGPSTAEVFARFNVVMGKGDPSRALKLRQFHQRLQTKDEEGDPVKPMMFIYENCDQFIRTIPNLTTSKTDIEDIDTNGEDHIFDESAHIVMSRPLSFEPPPKQKDAMSRRIDRLEQMPQDDDFLKEDNEIGEIISEEEEYEDIPVNDGLLVSTIN